eukprot:gene10554-10714_t
MGQSLSGIGSEHLNNEQLQLLHRKFARLCHQPADSNTSKKLQPAQLRSYIRDLHKLPELAGNPLVPRLFQLLDQDCDGSLSFEEFVKGVEWFGTLQNEENDIPRLYQLAFRVYDLNNDGYIDSEELYSMLQQIVGAGCSQQQLDHVVQATMVQYDRDGDWRLTLVEFVNLMNTTDLFSKFTFTLC